MNAPDIFLVYGPPNGLGEVYIHSYALATGVVNYKKKYRNNNLDAMDLLLSHNTNLHINGGNLYLYYTTGSYVQN